jgi:hypothetical protein
MSLRVVYIPWVSTEDYQEEEESQPKAGNVPDLHIPTS